MAMFLYATIFATILYTLYRRIICKSPYFIDWPIFGMLPQILYNVHQIYDYTTHVMNQVGCTGEFMGPWFTNLKYMITVDPTNLHHIMIKNFDNYVKGPEFREIFQVFGDGIIAVDSELWKYSRSLLHSLFKRRSFDLFVEKTIQNKVIGSLIPILDHVMRQGTVVDLQDVFCRFTFDNICRTIAGCDPGCLSIEFPTVAAEKAFDEAEESLFYRHIVPIWMWKLQKWLQIGEEKKMKKACDTLDEFLHSCIASKRQELMSKRNKDEAGEDDHDHDHEEDLLTALLRKEDFDQFNDKDKFLKDTVFTLLVAGRDTIASALTWFFWLIATNPLVEAKILEEIKENFGGNNEENKHKVLSMEEVKKLVYLHAALCESLRLFPPVPIERKQAINFDTLPSGHAVHPNTTFLFFFHAMARNEKIWGKDCTEFKPERWISEKGGIIYVPSFKFISFNAGPRTCLGKDSSFIQLKMVASAILRNYHVQVVEGYPITPKLSVILLMKHGLKVRITKREKLMEE